MIRKNRNSAINVEKFESYLLTRDEKLKDNIFTYRMEPVQGIT